MTDRQPADRAAPGVWDADAGAEVTAALVTSAITLWHQPVPAAVAAPTARLLANLLDLAEAGMRYPSVAQLMELYGGFATASAAGDPRPDAGEVFAAALRSGASVACAIGARDGGSEPDVDHHVVAFAALDAVAGASGAGSQEVLRAHAICASLAAGLQGVFDRTGTLDPRRSRNAVATVAAGIGAGLLRHGPDRSKLVHTVGLLASCSMATGPVPVSGDGWTLTVAKAAGNAVLASSLVERGFTTNPRALEAVRGLLFALTGELPDASAVEGLGDLTLRPPRRDSVAMGVVAAAVTLDRAERIGGGDPWTSIGDPSPFEREPPMDDREADR